jgi:hypothetical protein
MRWLFKILKALGYLIVFGLSTVLVDKGLTHLNIQSDFPDNHPPERFVVVVKHTGKSTAEDTPYKYHFYREFVKLEQQKLSEPDAKENTFP